MPKKIIPTDKTKLKEILEELNAKSRLEFERIKAEGFTRKPAVSEEVQAAKKAAAKKIYYRNLQSFETVCPTQFDCDIVDSDLYDSAYFRYRHGFFRMDLHKGPPGDYYVRRSYGHLYEESPSGEISFDEIQQIMLDEFNIDLVQA